MTKAKTSYQQILKATTLFGGVQIFNIILSMIRTKVIAILLGSTGVGMIGLFQNGIGLISSFSGLGISSSAIREISAANATEDRSKISRVIYVFNKWVLITGFLGVIIAIFCSPFFSKTSFGSYDYSWSFVAMAFTVLISAISTSQITIMRGLRRTKDIALANLLGGGIGLIVTVPMYYFFSDNGIVPSLIVSALIMLVCTNFFVGKTKFENLSLPVSEIFREGFSMVKFGVIMTISSFILTASTYLLSIYISRIGGVSEVGLYQSGFAITQKYVGLVFTAMALDYYPRLSAECASESKLSSLVSQQAEIALLIVTPILLLLLVSLPVVIELLYSSDFLPVIGLVQWLTIGVLFKTISWSIGFIILAKGDIKLYFITEVTSSVLFLTLNIIFYNFKGLEGLGISYIVGYVYYLILIWTICKKKYKLIFSNEFYGVALVSLIFSLFSFAAVRVLNGHVLYFVGVLIALLSIIFSIKILNERMDLFSSLRNRIKR